LRLLLLYRAVQPAHKGRRMTASDAAGGSVADRRGDVIAAAVSLFVLAAAAVSLRFYTRVKIVRVLGAEDWTVLVALVFSLGVSAGTITSESRGPPNTVEQPNNNIQWRASVMDSNCPKSLQRIAPKSRR